MTGYYASRLAAERLKRCYEVAPPKAQTYLRAEIEFVKSKLATSGRVLELGCGYGRVLVELVPHVQNLSGVDTSLASLYMVREELGPHGSHLAAMDAAGLGFRDSVFDVVICIQNGISAFAVDPVMLTKEAVRVTRSGGLVLLSSYAERFWPARLEWFEVQAAHGLIGMIDCAATGNGVIACDDGFRATTFSAERFRSLAAAVGLVPTITEVAESSLFCQLQVP